MNIGLASQTLAIAFACSPFAIHDCYAARIYNNLDQGVFVGGAQVQYLSQILAGFDDNVEIEAHQRSDSLAWTGDTFVAVYPGIPPNKNQLVCQVGFGPHAQIQGGNYMVIRKAKNNGYNNGFSCVVYDSNNHPIAGQ